jgi:amino-acid N-acetyltransferase
MNPQIQNQRTFVRNAKPSDFDAIQALLAAVNLPREEVKAHLDNFVVLLEGKKIIGTIGLEIYGEAALLRSLAVEKQYQGNGYGQRLYQAIVEKARQNQISEVYLLTETAEKFFAARGFEKITREEADPDVKTSVEFRSVCPQTAACMRLKLK